MWESVLKNGPGYSSVSNLLFMAGKVINSITSSKEFILHYTSITNTVCVSGKCDGLRLLGNFSHFSSYIVKCPPDIQQSLNSLIFYPFGKKLSYGALKKIGCTVYHLVLWCIVGLVYSPIMDVLATWRPIKNWIAEIQKVYCSIMNGTLFF